MLYLNLYCTIPFYFSFVSPTVRKSHRNIVFEGETMKRESLLGILMNLDHKQRMDWLPDMVTKEKLLDGCKMKWQSFWIPCSDMNDHTQNINRDFANKIIDMLEAEKIITLEK